MNQLLLPLLLLLVVAVPLIMGTRKQKKPRRTCRTAWPPATA